MSAREWVVYVLAVAIGLPCAFAWLALVKLWEVFNPPPAFRAPVPGVDILGHRTREEVMAALGPPHGQMECDVKHYEARR